MKWIKGIYQWMTANAAILLFLIVLLFSVLFIHWQYAVMGITFSNESAEHWNGVFTEFHGFIFDIILFGIVIAIYDAIRSRRERIQRYKEELNDYRGWAGEEAAYRIAGLIRRLGTEKVGDINFDELNLAKCQQEIIEKAVKTRAHIVSLMGTFLREANLQKANLQGANLQKVYLEGADLQKANLTSANLQKAYLASANLQKAYLGGANLQKAYLWGADLQKANLASANLQGVRVDEIDWIEKLKLWKVIGAEEIESKYIVDNTSHTDIIGRTSYFIKEKPKKEKSHVPKQCTAKTIRGNQCKRKPKSGFDKCTQHLGK